MADLRDLSPALERLKKQMPFALSQALTRVARQIQAAEKKAFQRKLDHPTPFTVNAVRAKGATKTHLIANVFVLPTTASYLAPFEFGGVHKLNSRVLLNPKDLKLNPYGNLPRHKLAQLKARANVFIGTVTPAQGEKISGVWQRQKAVKVKKGRKGLPRRRSANGVRQPRPPSRPPKLLIRFGGALPVKPVLGYRARAKAIAKARLPAEMDKALHDAMRTAK